MTALRQSRIRAERQRQRLVEAVKSEYEQQIVSLNERLRQQIIKTAQIETDLSTYKDAVLLREQRISELESKFARTLERVRILVQQIEGELT